MVSEAYLVRSLNEATINNLICNYNAYILIVMCTIKP